jgi:hypothetical protein
MANQQAAMERMKKIIHHHHHVFVTSSIVITSIVNEFSSITLVSVKKSNIYREKVNALKVSYLHFFISLVACFIRHHDELDAGR